MDYLPPNPIKNLKLLDEIRMLNFVISTHLKAAASQHDEVNSSLQRLV